MLNLRKLLFGARSRVNTAQEQAVEAASEGSIQNLTVETIERPAEESAPQPAPSPEPLKVYNIPVVDEDPYQRSMMYHSAGDQVAFVPAAASDLLSLNAQRHPVVHLHWDDRIFGRSEDRSENADFLGQCMTAIAAYREAGGRVVWTVHNEKPVEEIDMSAFADARRALVSHVDVIHVHTPHAKQHMVTEYGADPDLVHVIAHPSYLGVFEPAETTLSRPMPDPKTTQLLFLGSIDPETGAHRILDAAGKLTRRSYEYHLRMFGETSTAEQNALAKRLAGNPKITLQTDPVDPKDIAAIFGDAHFFVAPYESLFNAQNAILAQSFGLPVIGPDVDELKQVTPPETHHLLYNPASPRGLLRSLHTAISMSETDVEDLRRACLEHAKTIAPDVISPKLMTLLQPSRDI